MHWYIVVNSIGSCRSELRIEASNFEVNVTYDLISWSHMKQNTELDVGYYKRKVINTHLLFFICARSGKY